MWLGGWVFAWLVVVEVLEYLAGITLEHTLVVLVLLAIPGSWLILRYYMHIDRLRGGD